jgi:rubrerythrin
MSKTLRVLSFVVILVTAAAALPAGAATLDNLQAAFNGESNAHARYLAFAEKADSEGYGSVASLFRAAARAEEIHAAAHAEVIRSLGGEPEATIEAPKVGTTAENLEAAIEGESYERDTMYPEFLAAARADGQKGAVQSFTYAKTAEAEHAKLYGDALAKLDTLKGSSGVTYWVCTVCGYTVPKLDFQKCPSCFNPKDKYVAVA